MKNVTGKLNNESHGLQQQLGIVKKKHESQNSLLNKVPVVPRTPNPRTAAHARDGQTDRRKLHSRPPVLIISYPRGRKLLRVKADDDATRAAVAFAVCGGRGR